MTDNREIRERTNARQQALDADSATPDRWMRRPWQAGSAIYVPEQEER